MQLDNPVLAPGYKTGVPAGYRLDPTGAACAFGAEYPWERDDGCCDCVG
jgi:hypothetical protein